MGHCSPGKFPLPFHQWNGESPQGVYIYTFVPELCFIKLWNLENQRPEFLYFLKLHNSNFGKIEMKSEMEKILGVGAVVLWKYKARLCWEAIGRYIMLKLLSIIYLFVMQLLLDDYSNIDETL